MTMIVVVNALGEKCIVYASRSEEVEKIKLREFDQSTLWAEIQSAGESPIQDILIVIAEQDPDPNNISPPLSVKDLLGKLKASGNEKCQLLRYYKETITHRAVRWRRQGPVDLYLTSPVLNHYLDDLCTIADTGNFDAFLRGEVITQHLADLILGIKHISKRGKAVKRSHYSQYASLLDVYENAGIPAGNKCGINEAEAFYYTANLIFRTLGFFILTGGGMIRLPVNGNYYRIGFGDIFWENLKNHLTQNPHLLKDLLETLSKTPHKNLWSQIPLGKGAIEVAIPHVDTDLFIVHEPKEQEFVDTFFRLVKNKQQSRTYFSQFLEMLFSVPWSFVDRGEGTHAIIGITPETLSYIYEQLSGVLIIIEQSFKTGKQKISAEYIRKLLTDPETRRKNGIFYTSWDTIRFMVEEAFHNWLSRWLQNHGLDEKIACMLYGSPDIDKIKEVLRTIDREDRLQLCNDLRNIRIIDPACGSGAFLVGCGEKLLDLFNSLECEEKNERNIAMDIVVRNLYGVDISPRAQHIAIFRLILWVFARTISGAEEKESGSSLASKEQITDQEYRAWIKKLQVPVLRYNIRQGNSLLGFRKTSEFVQATLILGTAQIDKVLLPVMSEKAKGSSHPDKKLLFNTIYKYLKAPTRRQRTSIWKAISGYLPGNSLASLLRQFIDQLSSFSSAENKAIQEKVDEVLKEILSALERTVETARAKRDTTLLQKLDHLLELLKTIFDCVLAYELARQANKDIREVYQALAKARTFHFPAEFPGADNGFDIVISNPPYLRQEKIEEPKWLLEASVRHWYPSYMHGRTLSKRADYYVYFYFAGMSLLNEKGTFCFISSNSWLDVDFGKDLKEFFIDYGRLKKVIDNLRWRAFPQASINTVIVIAEQPRSQHRSNTEKKNEHVDFVAVRMPFRELLEPDICHQIHSTTFKKITPQISSLALRGERLRVRRIPLAHLKPTDKWGGTYLRAPDIYFTILQKGKGKLVRLGDIAEVRFGIKTGANEFFYLEPVGRTVKEVAKLRERDPKAPVRVKNSAGWEGEIEAAWLRPVIKSPREIKTLRVRLEDLRYLVFMPPEDVRQRIQRGAKQPWRGYPLAAAYIRWGQQQGYHRRPTCANRQWWWELPQLPDAQVLVRQFFDHKFDLPVNPALFLTDHTYYFLTSLKTTQLSLFGGLLNSTLFGVMANIFGRVNQAEGVLTFYGPEGRRILLPHPKSLTTDQHQRLLSAFNRLATRPIRSIFEELGFQLCREKGCPHPEHPYEHVNPEQLSDQQLLAQVKKTSPDRYELDKVIFDVLGLDDPERAAVYRAVVQLVKDRLVKAKSV